MPRKPKRLMIEELLIENFELDGLDIQEIYRTVRDNIGDLGMYGSVKFSTGGNSQYPEDGEFVHIVGDRLETDEEYEKRLTKLKNKKAKNLENNKAKLDKINSKMAQLEKEKRKLQKTNAKIEPAVSRIESIT